MKVRDPLEKVPLGFLQLVDHIAASTDAYKKAGAANSFQSDHKSWRLSAGKKPVYILLVNWLKWVKFFIGSGIDNPAPAP